MIVISHKNCPGYNEYDVSDNGKVIGSGVNWNTAIKLVSELASIVWSTNDVQETLDYCDNPDPILRKGKLYAEQTNSGSLIQFVAGFDQETGLIDNDPNATSYVRQEGVDYFLCYEDALASYKEQVDIKLGELHTELNYWNKVKLSLE